MINFYHENCFPIFFSFMLYSSPLIHSSQSNWILPGCQLRVDFAQCSTSCQRQRLRPVSRPGMLKQNYIFLFTWYISCLFLSNWQVFFFIKYKRFVLIWTLLLQVPSESRCQGGCGGSAFVLDPSLGEQAFDAVNMQRSCGCCKPTNFQEHKTCALCSKMRFSVLIVTLGIYSA